MTTLDQYARPEWAAPRKETWYEHLLPQRVTDTINQSPLVGALSKYMNSPPPDLTLPSERDKQVPMPRSPSWFDDRPIATDALDKFGLLANFIGPGAKLPPPAPKPTGIRAYHGSPHDFDKFDMSKIGTGEGAQAYGRGLYFAEAEGVAGEYRKQLGTRSSSVRDSDGNSIAGTYLEATNFDKEAAKALFKKKMSERGLDVDKQILKDIDTAAGRMYEVKINADPETFLDWDKPLSQQSEAVKKAYADALKSLGHHDPSKIEGSAFASSGGGLENLVNTWARYDRAKASQALREAGIPGIKYLDQGSRTAGQGSRNYVVFDDKLIEILRKYGLLPPVAAGAAGTALNEAMSDGTAPNAAIASSSRPGVPLMRVPQATKPANAGSTMPGMPLREMIGYRGLRRPPAEPTTNKPIHQRTLEEDGFGIWHGATPDVANSYAMSSMINNTPERQAMEAARQARFKKDFGTKRWDSDLEYLIASEMDQKAGRSYLANDGSNVAMNRLLFRNPLVLDFDGKNFNSWRDFNTNVAARMARERGHDALIARNVVDYGDLGYLPPWREGRPATSVAVFDRSQVVPFWQGQKADLFDPTAAEALSIAKFLEAVR